MQSLHFIPNLSKLESSFYIYKLAGTICGFHSSCNLQNHYQTLGINVSASNSQVKDAYYKLSMKHHPDRNGGNEAANKFRQATAAYEVLKNPSTRATYDRSINHRSAGYAGGSTNKGYSYRPPNNFQNPYVYESYFKSSTRPNAFNRQEKKPRQPMTGKTEHFDYDAWMKANYSDRYESQKRDRRWQNEQWINYRAVHGKMGPNDLGEIQQGRIQDLLYRNRVILMFMLTNIFIFAILCVGALLAFVYETLNRTLFGQSKR